MTKTADIRKKSDEELKKMAAEYRETVRGLRFKIASKELKNNQQMRLIKKDIARILTILRERHA